MQVEDARAFFGLGREFSFEDLKQARRAKLLVAHPDHGGSVERLELVDMAFDSLRDESRRHPVDESAGLSRRDFPSFTISVLPVEAFELLLLATAELGEVIDDDPPYRLEVMMFDPIDVWVIFDLVPDAGSTTVTLSLEGRPSVSIEALRDRWIGALNDLQMP